MGDARSFHPKIRKATRRAPRQFTSEDVDLYVGALYRRAEHDFSVYRRIGRTCCVADPLRHSYRASRRRLRVSYQRAIKQLSTALRRANQPKGGLPEDIRLVLGLNRMIHHLAAYGKAHRKPKPDAIRKRLTADYALDLCERFGVKITIQDWSRVHDYGRHSPARLHHKGLGYAAGRRSH
jgi:hypothetical protein